MTNFGLLRSVTTQEITRYVDQDESVEGDKIDDDDDDDDNDDDDDDDDDVDDDDGDHLVLTPIISRSSTSSSSFSLEFLKSLVTTHVGI